MKRNIVMLTLAWTGLFSACTEDRIIPDDPIILPPVNANLPLRLNELVAKGSMLASEFGNTSDWIEMVNAGNQSFSLEAGAWFISDDPNNLTKFGLPAWTLPAGDRVVLFCDDSNCVATQIHTNFGLASSGERVFLSYQKNGQTTKVDSVQYGPQTFDNMAIARTPDAVGNWQYPLTPTPGQPNP